MARSKRAENERLQLAREAHRIVEEELAGMSVPSRMLAQSRAAERLKISTRTLWRRLVDVPADGPSSETIGAAPVKLTNSGAPGTKGLGSVLATLIRHHGPSRITLENITKDVWDELLARAPRR